MSQRLIVLAGLLLLLGGVVHAAIDEATQAILQPLPTTAEYPGDDAVWLLREMEITVAPSGAFTVHERKLVHILTMQGASLAQWEIPYDKALETVRVLTARTLLHGQIFPVDPAQMAESAVYPGLAWYDSMVIRRFPLPAAMPGATLEVVTEHARTMPRVPGAFSTRLYLCHRHPIRTARYTIRIPVAQRLQVRFTGEGAPEVTTTVEGEHRVYRWTVRQAPGVTMHEPQAPPAKDVLPSAHLTTLAGWEPVVSWYQRITQGKDAVTDDLRRFALARTANCRTMDDKIAALHKAVREIPYVAMEMGELSDVPHDADAVARRNYGDCKDKATLLRALLKAVDIPAEYVLVRTTPHGRLDRRQYGADEFNHVILAVSTPTGNRFLDATMADVPAHRLPPGVDGAEGLIVRGQGELVTLPASTAAENRTLIRVQVTVRPDGSATGNAVLTFHGMNAILQRGRLARVAPERHRDALEGYLAPRLGNEIAVETVTVEGMREPERPLTITVAFSSPHYLQAAGDQLSGYLPGFAQQPTPYRTTTTRQYPFDLGMASSLRLDAVITLPATLHVSHLPAPVSHTSRIGRYEDTLSAKGEQLIYACELAQHRGVFPAQALDEIRAWSAVLAQEGRNQLQFFVRRR